MQSESSNRSSPGATASEKPEDAKKLPLQGLRVLDLSRVLAGPVCCQVLADLGADVVKVEKPGSGDDTRNWGPPFLPADSAETTGLSAYFLSANRGKKSLTLDLSHPQGQAVLIDLLQVADIMVENFLPHTIEKLGLTPENLKKINPQLISVAISGYGRTGPLAEKPGYDLVLQATSGIMSITGEPEGEPMKIGVAITDVITGLYGTISALAGLQAKKQTGQGHSFDLALSDCALASLVNVIQGALITTKRPKRHGNAHPHIVPYQAFATQDGYLVLAVGNDSQWQRFCQCTGQTDLANDSRFMTNPLRVNHREVLVPILKHLFSSQNTNHWEQLLTSADVPHAKVMMLDEILETPQVAARELIETMQTEDDQEQEYALLKSPIHTDGESLPIRSAPPKLGADTETILKQWLQYSDQTISQLQRNKIV